MSAFGRIAVVHKVAPARYEIKMQIPVEPFPLAL
jgi:hypothetical protein